LKEEELKDCHKKNGLNQEDFSTRGISWIIREISSKGRGSKKPESDVNGCSSLKEMFLQGSSYGMANKSKVGGRHERRSRGERRSSSNSVHPNGKR